MIRKIDVGSVFGNAQRTSYEYMKLLDKKTNGDFKTLVVDDKWNLVKIVKMLVEMLNFTRFSSIWRIL